MPENPESLAANIPADFSRDLAELPADYVLTHGLLAISSARLELFLAVAVNMISHRDIWPSNEKNFPDKASQRIRWLEKVFQESELLASFKTEALAILKEAGEINSARNDVIHGGILAHGPKGDIYVSRVRVDQKGQRFRLEEGSSWTQHDVGDITIRCANCEQAVGNLVSAMAKAGEG